MSSAVDEALAWFGDQPQPPLPIEIVTAGDRWHAATIVRAALAGDVPAGRDLTARDVHSAIRSAAGGAEVFAQAIADHLNRIARGGQR